MEPALQRNRDNLWAVRLRADIHRRQGQDKEILKDEMQIWDRREDGDYQGYAADFACSAFRRGMFQEAIDRADAYHGASEEQALVQLLSGLSYLAQGDLEAGVERLSAAVESCVNL
jgi:LAS superfamily LD-carboxypeptidase LdcB